MSLLHPVMPDGMHPQFPSEAQNSVQHCESAVHGELSGVQPVSGPVSGPASEPASAPIEQNVEPHCDAQVPHVHCAHAFHSVIAFCEAAFPQFDTHALLTSAHLLTHALSVVQMLSFEQVFCWLEHSFDDDCDRQVWQVCGTPGLAPSPFEPASLPLPPEEQPGNAAAATARSRADRPTAADVACNRARVPATRTCIVILHRQESVRRAPPSIVMVSDR